MTTSIVPQNSVDGKLSLLELASLELIAAENAQDAYQEQMWRRQQHDDEASFRRYLSDFLKDYPQFTPSAVHVVRARRNWADCVYWVPAAWVDEVLFGFFSYKLVVLRPYDDGWTYAPSAPLKDLTDLLDAYREEPIPLHPEVDDEDIFN